MMWIFTTKGFLSIVQHNSMPGHFQVKSRAIDPLEALWPDQEIEEIDWADYRFRITMTKEKTLDVLTTEVRDVTYTSFKDQCREDHDYHYALTRVWSIMYNYQQGNES